MTKHISWLASATGIIGALIIAMNIGVIHIGYAVFIVSSFSWIFYSIKTKQNSLLFMNIVFGIINIIGFIKYID